MSHTTPVSHTISQGRGVRRPTMNLSPFRMLITCGNPSVSVNCRSLPKRSMRGYSYIRNVTSFGTFVENNGAQVTYCARRFIFTFFYKNTNFLWLWSNSVSCLKRASILTCAHSKTRIQCIIHHYTLFGKYSTAS